MEAMECEHPGNYSTVLAIISDNTRTAGYTPGSRESCAVNLVWCTEQGKSREGSRWFSHEHKFVGSTRVALVL